MTYSTGVCIVAVSRDAGNAVANAILGDERNPFTAAAACYLAGTTFTFDDGTPEKQKPSVVASADPSAFVVWIQINQEQGKRASGIGWPGVLVSVVSYPGVRLAGERLPALLAECGLCLPSKE